MRKNRAQISQIPDDAQMCEIADLISLGVCVVCECDV